MHFFIFIFLLFSSCCLAQSDNIPHVLVSIAPEKFFVEQIAKNSVVVDVLVPPGASPHSFEPSPKQLIAASQAVIWFRIGEPFEARALEVLKNHQPKLLVIDLRQNIPLISMDPHAKCKACAHHDDKDTHIWLSPKLAQIQAKTIKDALIQMFPQYQAEYEKNFSILIHELELLDMDLSKIFQHMNPRFILVSHPAFGYLAQEFHFKQLSLEIEGKDPSSRQLTLLLDQAKSLKLKRVFTQQQYQNKGALLIAKELKAEVYDVDPYSADYINNLKKISQLFANQ